MLLKSFFFMSLITAAINCCFAVFVYLKGKNRPVNILWSLLGISSAFWILGLGCMSYAPTENIAEFFLLYVHYPGAICIPAFFLHFVVVLTEQDTNRSYRILIRSAYIIAAAMIAADISNLLATVAPLPPFRYYTQPKAFYLFYTLEFAVFVSFGLYLLFRSYTTATADRKNQYKYMFLAMIIGFTGGSTAFFPVFSDSLFPYGVYFVFLHIPVVSYAIVKYRLMDIRIAITRAGISLFVYSFTLGFPFWFAFKTGEWFWALVLMGVLASIGPLIYHVLHMKAENILLAQQRHYQSILLQASAGMVREHDLNRLLKVMTHLVKKSVKIKFAAAFLDDNETNSYVLKALRDSGRTFRELSFPFNHPLIVYIKEHKEPFKYEELPATLRQSVKSELDMHLIIPSFIEDRLIGFLVLGGKLNNTLYSQDDMNVFQTLSNQAALAIENCRFMEEFKKTQERIFNAEKLASIGGLAEGVAHQIRNRLNHFSVTSGELKLEVEDFTSTHVSLLEQNPDLKKTLSYLSEIGDSLLTNVRRTDGIINGILHYARVEAKESYFSQFFLASVIEPSLDLLKVKHELESFPLEVSIASTDIIYGVKSQLMESMFNILDNAFEAIQDRKDQLKEMIDPKIRLTVTQHPDSTFIEVTDNGIGIKEEDKHKIFAPFFTTKSSYKSGTGIGMYVVKRMVEENHKGKIWFASEHGVGTTFYIKLPKNKPEQLIA